MQTLSQFFSQIPVLYKTAALLLLSNCFMTFAWYAHLKNLGNSPLWVAIISSWLIAFFEYCIMVPANRIGFSGLSLGQLKILQEVISLSIFVPFAFLYMKQPLNWTICGLLCACSAPPTSCSATSFNPLPATQPIPTGY